MKLFELYAELGLDSSNFNNGINAASSAGKNFTEKASQISAVAVAMGHALYEAGKKAVEMAADLAKAVVNEYAETEQLIGGVETMFKEHAGDVIENASNAFRTAGMSANDYMKNVTDFSASLLQGLDGDTAKAAAVADMAIQDMADNANKFGTNIGAIQNAYQGFAKDNFTMLDNLKLGYGGTQEEMARLVNESGVLGESIKVTAETVKDVPLDKIFEAIHKIQEEMGVTGTTAKEASSTISGSASSFAAAWSNVLAGLGNKDADMDKLMDDLFETGKTYVGNIMALLPTIAENAKEAFVLLGNEISTMLDSAYANLRIAWDTTLPQAITDGANAIISQINTLFGTNIPAIESIKLPTWEELSESVSTWWAGVRSGLETAAEWTLGIFTNPTATAEDMKAAFSAWWSGTAKPAIEAAAQWTLSLFTAPTESQEAIIAVVSKWWSTAGEWVSNACSWVLQLFGVPTETAEQIASVISTWWNGIASVFADVCKVVFSLAAGDTETAKEVILSWWEAIKTTVASLLQVGFDIITPSLIETIGKLQAWWDQVKKSLGFVVETTATVHTSEGGVSRGGGGRSFGDLPGHANGLDWVPYDNYVARLHQGEAVLTRSEASEWRSGNTFATANIEKLLSAILTAVQNPIPAVIDGDSVFRDVSSRMTWSMDTRR